MRTEGAVNQSDILWVSQSGQLKRQYAVQRVVRTIQPTASKLSIPWTWHSWLQTVFSTLRVSFVPRSGRGQQGTLGSYIHKMAAPLYNRAVPAQVSQHLLGGVSVVKSLPSTPALRCLISTASRAWKCESQHHRWDQQSWKQKAARSEKTNSTGRNQQTFIQRRSKREKKKTHMKTQMRWKMKQAGVNTAHLCIWV